MFIYPSSDLGHTFIIVTSLDFGRTFIIQKCYTTHMCFNQQKHMDFLEKKNTHTSARGSAGNRCLRWFRSAPRTASPSSRATRNHRHTTATRRTRWRRPRPRTPACTSSLPRWCTPPAATRSPRRTPAPRREVHRVDVLDGS